MAVTFANARTILQAHIADSSDDTFADQCLNVAQREVARARRWPELIVRDFFNTEAAYETGTIAVTENTTTVTLTSGVWPANIETNLWRFALSISDPWYEVATRTGDTSMELADNYVQDTETASSYIVYRSHYSLASAVDRIEGIWLHDAGQAIQLVNAATDQQVTEFLHYPSGPGTPTHYYPMERDASGNRQILLGPETPDTVFRVEYVYKKDTTDGTLGLDDARWPVVLARALSLAYAPEYYERSIAEYQKYLRLLDEEWAREMEAPINVRVGDSRVRYPGGDTYLDNLLGYGRVSDPT